MVVLNNIIKEFKEVGLVVKFGLFELFYLGVGYVMDNVMVWLFEKRILFGGCVVWLF